MSKKRNRQPDANGDASGGSTESCEETAAAACKCPHVTKAINLTKIKKNIKKSGIPTECPVCKKNEEENAKSDKEKVDTVKATLWICLQCGNLGCGREDSQHAIEHYLKPHSDCHYMVVNTRSWTIWCYPCETEINPLCRRKLQETVDFIKKSVAMPCTSLQAKTPVTQCQKEIANVDEEKQTIYSNLPKVGGLANLGNTCFFNAVLQCLAQTPFLIKVLDDLRLPGQKFVLPGGKHKPKEDAEELELPPIEGTLERWGSFTSILCKTLTEMQSSNDHQTYTPMELLCSFRKKAMKCMDGGQHDSHELLRHLLELVRNEDLRRYQSVILKEVGLNEKTNPEGVAESLKSRVKFYGNQASARLLGPEPVFRGVLVSTLECLDCSHLSQRTEPFLDLSLPVMADKPQPPVLRRKNSGLEDTFDTMGNNISHAPSKYQTKKERQAARRNRKNRRLELDNICDTIENQNNIMEENNGNMLEREESDADVEDNVEVEGTLPKAGETEYNSEKAPMATSFVYPANHHIFNQNVEPSNISNDSSTDNTETSSSIGDYLGVAQAKGSTNANITLNSPSLTDVSMTDLTQMRLSSEADRMEESSGDSPKNKIGVSTDLALYAPIRFKSYAMNFEGRTANLSNSAISKGSPSSPLSSTINGDEVEKVERPVSRLDHADPVADTSEVVFSFQSTDRIDRFSRNLYDQFNPTVEEFSTQVCNNQYEACNGLNGVTTNLSKLGIVNNAHQSPTRYPSKEGECSIQSCLNQFTALELMSGSNKVRCEACTARERKTKEGSTKIVSTPSTKQYLISEVPAVLILHLKRFQAQRVDFRKVTKHVAFPLLLNLAPVCKGHKKSRVYALYGVVEHSGTIHGGHYVAYVKTRLPLSADDPRWSFLPPKDAEDTEETSEPSDSDGDEASASACSAAESPPGKWYYVSDSRVMEVDEATVLQSQAYLLFYERIL
ncbi:hypothetical protein KM043_008640 [Ampulex compressa]|nr:hypothetical protein KM043_008640 [Ampulex compressa]